MCGFAAQESMMIPCGMESPFSFPLAEKKTAIHGQKDVYKRQEYYSALRLGEPTGIEIGESTGRQAVNESGQDQAPWAAFGQANQEYTPLQLANYIATLVSGGKHYPAHLLKNVKSYDNSEIIATGDTEPLNTLNISDSTLQAVKKGMLGYTTNGGSVAGPFQNLSLIHI